MGISESKDRKKQGEAAKSKSDKQPKNTVITCPQVEYELVELVEVMRTAPEKEMWVKGAGMDCSDSKVITESVERKDKDGANFKQYINLKKNKNIIGEGNELPEYGRYIFFRARIRQKNGQEDKLAGVRVNLSFKRVDGPNRSGAVWDGVPVSGTIKEVIFDGSGIPICDTQQEGFDGTGGKAGTYASTDANGWTDRVMFILSAFGGDQFKISCKLDPSTPGAKGSKALSTKANYVVWHKFWYQMTYAEGKEHKPPEPAGAQKNFEDVFAEMIRANVKTFRREDLPADLQDRTFLKEYMLNAEKAKADGKGSEKTVVNVGDGSNLEEFGSNAALKMTKEPIEHPIKENLIVCEYQCDPKGRTPLKIYTLTAIGQSIPLIQGTGGPIVSKPAIKAGSRLVFKGEWGTQKKPWVRRGYITDNNIEIDPNRPTALAIKVKLPGAPAPVPAHPVYVRLQVETAEEFVGGATEHGIIAVYRKDKDGEPCVESGSKQNFNCTTAHEFGHKWYQTSEPKEQPASLKDHPLQYVAHGGQGSHCMYGAAVNGVIVSAQKPHLAKVNWQNEKQEEPEPAEGKCLMFHKSSSNCKHEFCQICKPYLQLQDMISTKP